MTRRMSLYPLVTTVVLACSACSAISSGGTSPDIDSDAYTRAFDEVKGVGRRDSPTRIDDQTHLAMWWCSRWIPVYREDLPASLVWSFRRLQASATTPSA